VSGGVGQTAAAPARRAGPVGRLGRWLGRLSPTGPILGKELRVSGRRRRTYLMRAVFLGLLTLFVGIVWHSAVARGPGVYTVSQMSEAGRGIVATIVWVEFCAAQLIAVVMCSTSISEEVQRRTLGVLLTTPISSFQIVAGKLASKLLQLVILLAVSLPLLMVVRVFGGVPWRFVAAGLTVSLTACLFAACVSMFFSVLLRRAYASILATLGVGFLLYFLAPMLVRLAFMTIGGIHAGPDVIELISVLLCLPNPFGVLSMETGRLMMPGSGVPGGNWLWPAHCGVMLGLSAALTALCVVLVRRVALRAIGGGRARQSGRPSPATLATAAEAVTASTASQASPASLAAAPAALPRPARRGRAQPAKIRRVGDEPVRWRELRGFGRRGRLARAILFVAAFVLMGLIYLVAHDVLLVAHDVLDEPGFHASVACVITALGLIATAVIAATPITSEKEARSWPILLATPMSSRQVAMGKLLGTLRRVLPLWGLLAGHLLLFVLAGVLHPLLLPLVAMTVAWATLFLSCTGLLLGVLVGKTTTAVMVNLGVGMVLWAIAPILLSLADIEYWNGEQHYFNSIPPYQVGMLTYGSAWESWDYTPFYHQIDWLGPGTTFLYVLVYAVGYGLLSMICFLAAVRSVRRRIF
jgi:ABC-type transport system involved in multi-copper enzyme maturation permease subunit